MYVISPQESSGPVTVPTNDLGILFKSFNEKLWKTHVERDTSNIQNSGTYRFDQSSSQARRSKRYAIWQNSGSLEVTVEVFAQNFGESLSCEHPGEQSFLIMASEIPLSL